MSFRHFRVVGLSRLAKTSLFGPDIFKLNRLEKKLYVCNPQFIAEDSMLVVDTESRLKGPK